MNATNEDPRRPTWSRQDSAVAVIGVVLLAANTFPGYALANRVEPIVLGMPFGMFWIVSWIILGGLALLLVYRRWDRRQKTDSLSTDAAPASGEGER